VPSAGIALVLGVDRPLDMLRTTNNITGDTMVASVIAASEDELVMPGDGQAVTTDGVSAAMEQETTG
jgi:Na+/H+-dicarboxylate symporter